MNNSLIGHSQKTGNTNPCFAMNYSLSTTDC